MLHHFIVTLVNYDSQHVVFNGVAVCPKIIQAKIFTFMTKLNIASAYLQCK